jgi:hypothetical protein
LGRAIGGIPALGARDPIFRQHAKDTTAGAPLVASGAHAGDPCDTFLAITGMIDASAVRSVEAAVLGIDPSAQLEVWLLAGLVSVDSDTEVAAFCAAIEARGLIAEPTTGVMTRTSQLLSTDETSDVARGTMAGLILHALLWAIACLFITFIIYFVPMLMMAFLCNCDRDLITLPAVAAMLGAIIAFAITVALGTRRRRRSDVQDDWE